MPHKDQIRVRDALLPSMMDRVYASESSAERDCTVLNRAFLQGPDPLFLMETCPKEFTALCGELDLSEVLGRDAIEQAHWRGPGILLDGQGIPLDYLKQKRRALLGQSDEPLTPISDAWKREALWLILASLSDTTEEDYKKDITFIERLQRVTAAAINFGDLLTRYSERPVGPMGTALQALNEFDASTVFTRDAQGIPLTDVDHGFYIGYKRGYEVVGVHHGDKTFYGTVPGTTLHEQGVKVDVNVSESYGFVRDPTP
jgi:hypothetical protein